MAEKISLSGELRAKVEERARLRPKQHETAAEVLDREKTNLVITTKDEADAVENILDRTAELNDLSHGEEQAAKRVRTALYTARGDLLKEQMEEA